MKNFWVNPEDFDKVFCNAWVATAIVGAAAVGGIANAYSANQAAAAQTAAGNNAANLQLNAVAPANATLQNQTTTNNQTLSPYTNLGAQASSQLGGNLSQYTTPIAMDQNMLALQAPINLSQSDLESIPGYQFEQQQGLKATQNSAAARGLGVSGAALKGAATFSQGLASSDYQNLFNTQLQNVDQSYSRYNQTYQNQVTNQSNAFNRLSGLVNTGEAAAGTEAGLGTASALQQSKNITGAASGAAGNITGVGNAQGAADIATGNAISNATNSIAGYAAYQGLYGPNSAFATNVGNLPATGAGSPSNAVANQYAISQGINPY